MFCILGVLLFEIELCFRGLIIWGKYSACVKRVQPKATVFVCCLHFEVFFLQYCFWLSQIAELVPSSGSPESPFTFRISTTITTATYSRTNSRRFSIRRSPLWSPLLGSTRYLLTSSLSSPMNSSSVVIRSIWEVFLKLKKIKFWQPYPLTHTPWHLGHNYVLSVNTTSTTNSEPIHKGCHGAHAHFYTKNSSLKGKLTSFISALFFVLLLLLLVVVLIFCCV